MRPCSTSSNAPAAYADLANRGADQTPADDDPLAPHRRGGPASAGQGARARSGHTIAVWRVFPDEPDLLYARALINGPRRHRRRGSRPAPHPRHRAGQRRRAQCPRLHARRPHHALPRGAGADRPRTRRGPGQRRDHRQLRLGAVSPRPQCRGAGRVAARVRFEQDPEIAAHLGEVLWVQGDKDEARRFRRIAQAAARRQPRPATRAGEDRRMKSFAYSRSSCSHRWRRLCDAAGETACACRIATCLADDGAERSGENARSCAV